MVQTHSMSYRQVIILSYRFSTSPTASGEYGSPALLFYLIARALTSPPIDLVHGCPFPPSRLRHTLSSTIPQVFYTTILIIPQFIVTPIITFLHHALHSVPISLLPRAFLSTVTSFPLHHTRSDHRYRISQTTYNSTSSTTLPFV